MLSWFGIYGIGNLRKNANHEVEKEKNTQYVRVYSRINNVHVLAGKAYDCFSVRVCGPKCTCSMDCTCVCAGGRACSGAAVAWTASSPPVVALSPAFEPSRRLVITHTSTQLIILLHVAFIKPQTSRIRVQQIIVSDTVPGPTG